jgi:hypothetical protein
VLSDFFQLSGPKFANVPANTALFAVYVLNWYKGFGTKNSAGMFNAACQYNNLADGLGM